MRGGLPDPLFEDVDELQQLGYQSDGGSVIYYLLFEASIGPLRSADPILGDLTVMAREAVDRMAARVKELFDEAATDELRARAKAKAESIRASRVEGAVPEDQA